MPRSRILFDSTIYKGTSETQNVNKNKKESLTGNITTGHYERFEETRANMTTRRAERITAFCLYKISRQCDFRSDAPVRTTAYIEDFGDDCKDLGLPSTQRQSVHCERENIENNPKESQVSVGSFQEEGRS